MAKPKNYLHKKKGSILRLFLILGLLLVLSLVIPAIGVGASSPVVWIKIVTFFESIRIHFASYWMFYTFILAVLVAYFGNKKK